MSEREAVRCCGRAMTSIGVEQAAGELRLHSCPSCGRHAWRNGEREVGRAEVLASLRPVRRPAPRPVEVARQPEPVQAEPDRRTELQRLLAGFTVHGSTS